MIGQTISHYRIIEKLGSGGMGVVYKAEDTKLRRTVALKFPPIDNLALEEDRARFVREAQAAAAVNHPNICTVHEIGEADDHTYIAMEFVEGESVKERVRARPLPLGEALQIAIQAAQGLQAAHEKGVVHRDIKGTNLMLTKRGQVKVMDFGLARVADRSQLTQTGTTLGTPAYMSPEQALAQRTDHRSDIWSLGVVLYEMLTGELPFKGEVEAAIAYAVVNTEPEPVTALRSGLPVELDHVIEKALAKKPSERYQHVEDLLVDLQALATSIQSGGTAAVTRPRRLRKKRIRNASLAALATAALALAASFYFMRGRLSNAPAEGAALQAVSLVVLPLDNLSGDPNQEFFSDGMTDELIADLGKISALKVISRTSAMRYKGTQQPLQEIARDLKVSHVVAGSVMQVGDQLRITAQLVDPATDQQLWSDSFVRERRDILGLQAQVARTIAQQIRVRLSPQEQARLARSAAVDPEAYDAYLKGRFHVARWSPADNNAAFDYFRLATEKAPDFAQGYAGLAIAWAQRQQLAGLAAPGEAGPKARAAVARALELDSTHQEVQLASALVEGWVEWNWEAGDTAFRRVLDINPNYADAHAFYAHFLFRVRRPEEAMRQIEQAIELDPYNPMFQAMYGQDLVFAGRYDEAIAQLLKALQTAPNSLGAHTGLHTAFYQKAMYKEALDHWKAKFSIRGEAKIVRALDRGYGEGGYERAMTVAAETLAAESKTATNHVSWFVIANLYADAGNREQTLNWLEKAYEARDPTTPFIHVIPSFAFLRGETRFQNLLRRMNVLM